MTATPLPQCDDCPLRPFGGDARCAWCIAPGRYRREPSAMAGALPPWLTNTGVDRSRRRSTVEAILRNYRPDEVNWSAVASLLGVSRQAVHQLKRRLVESAARPPEQAAAISEAYETAARSPRHQRRGSGRAVDGAAGARWPDARQGGGRAASAPGQRQRQRP